MNEPRHQLLITISGLCLMVVEGNRRDEHVDSVRVLVPDATDHRSRLTFRRTDRDRQDPEDLERFFGPDGEDLLSLPLHGVRGHFWVEGNANTKFFLNWAPKETNRPVPDEVADWLIDAEDLELRPRNFDKITSWIELPPGRVSSKNIIRLERPVLWKYPKDEEQALAAGREPEKRRHAMADDAVLETRVTSPISFVWRRNGEDEKRIDFKAPVDRPLELCISNDDFLDTRYGIEPENPHEDLRNVAEALGQPREELDIPIEADEQRTNGWYCPLIACFDSQGVFPS